MRRQKIFLTCLFLLIVGCILLRFSKFSGRQKETHQINAACEAYRDEVSSEAAQYDMSDYVDLILAVMMQESSGQGTDPMQSSEGAYNTRYPQQPNGITDPSYSISCGIQELKYALEKAVCTGTISEPIPILLIWKKTVRLCGRPKVLRPLLRWQAAAHNVMKMIPFMILPVHGTMVTNTIRIMFCAITT